MAGSSLYSDDESGGITDINVTPFVDVVLVLLVVFMVTAKLIVARGVEIDKAKASHGGPTPSTLRLTVTEGGKLYVNGEEVKDDATAIEKIKAYAAVSDKPRVIVSGDRRTEFQGVMHALDLAQDAGITALALENTAKDSQ